jgi:reactive intermediate/imine deaminase
MMAFIRVQLARPKFLISRSTTRQKENTMKCARLASVAAAGLAILVGGCTSTSPLKQIHSTTDVYPAIGPYSQMVQAGNLYFLAGVIPLNKAGNAVQGTTIEEQTRLVLDYIGATLKSQGMNFSNVVMSNVYMKDLNEFAAMNKIYAEYFKSGAPARSTVEVARLPRDVKIEIAVIASK